MTNYNERLDEIIGLLNSRMPQPKTINEAKARVAMCHESKQAFTTLMKELVAEAKPTEKPTDDTKIGSWEEGHQNVGYNRAVIEFEQNLLKALEEV